MDTFCAPAYTPLVAKCPKKIRASFLLHYPQPIRPCMPRDKDGNMILRCTLDCGEAKDFASHLDERSTSRHQFFFLIWSFGAYCDCQLPKRSIILNSEGPLGKPDTVTIRLNYCEL